MTSFEEKPKQPKSDLGVPPFYLYKVTDTIDTTRPIDYGQLYAQAMYEIYHGERYWFDVKMKPL